MHDSTHDPLAAIEHLLPPEVQEQRRLERRQRNKQTAERTGVVGLGAVLIALGLKFKWLAVAAKFLVSLGSLVLSIWAWGLFYGVSFATGFVLLILVHELGHVIAIRAYGLKASLPMFVPFLGAFVALKEQPSSSKAEAVIALAGPAMGTVGALACYWIGARNGQLFWYALASTGFFINLFNLIPIRLTSTLALDGWRVAKALRSREMPMTGSERLMLTVQSLALAGFLLAMWRIAGTAAHLS